MGKEAFALPQPSFDCGVKSESHSSQHDPADSLNESVESRRWQAWAFGRELFHDFAANTSLCPLEGHTWQALVPCPQKAPHVLFDCA